MNASTLTEIAERACDQVHRVKVIASKRPEHIQCLSCRKEDV